MRSEGSPSRPGVAAILLAISLAPLGSPSEAYACVLMPYCSPRQSFEECVRARFQKNTTVVLARVKSVYTDHLLIWRTPAYNGYSRLTYAELEILEEFKGTPTDRIFRVAHSPLSSCEGDGPFEPGKEAIFAISRSTHDGPAVPFDKQEEFEGQPPALVERYYFGNLWPDLYQGQRVVTILRKLKESGRMSEKSRENPR